MPNSFEQILQTVSLSEIERDFDDSSFDPMFCGLVVALIKDSE